MPDDTNITLPPPLAPHPPDKEQQIRNSTVYIERWEANAHEPATGSGVVVAGSGGLIVTAEHVASGKDSLLKIYTAEHKLIGTAEIVARGHDSKTAQSFENDQVVLRMVDIVPGMEEYYKTLGIPLARNQSANALAFRLPDLTQIKHGNSGGPVVNAQGELIGLNEAISPENDPRLQPGTSIVTPMSNPIINQALLGNAARNIHTYQADGKPIPATSYGFRKDSLYQFNADLYQSPKKYSDGLFLFVPEITRSFQAAAEETVVRKNGEPERLPTFRDQYTDQQPNSKGSAYFKIGHNDQGQTFVNYNTMADGKARQVILYFNDPNNKIAPWMRAEYRKDADGIFKTLLGEHETDFAQMSNTLNQVANPTVAAQVTPAAPVATARPATPLPIWPPIVPTPAPVAPPSAPQAATPQPSPAQKTAPTSPSTQPPGTAPPLNAPPQHFVPPAPPQQPHPAIHKTNPGTPHEQADSRVPGHYDADYLNDIEHHLNHPKLPVTKDATYLALEQNILARKAEIAAYWAKQKQPDARGSNLGALKAADYKTPGSQTANATTAPVSLRPPSHSS